MFIVDPKAIVSALGLLLAAVNGGQPIGYGAELVLVYDGSTVEVGIDPRIYMRVEDLPLGLSGITMSNVVLLHAGTPDQYPAWALPQIRRIHARVLAYEDGHFYGWQRFGLSYALTVVEDPATYDPCIMSRRATCEQRAWEDATLAPPRHSLFRLRVALSQPMCYNTYEEEER